VRGVPKAQRRGVAQRLIREVGLAGFEQHYRHELWGGMRQRANIIRTLSYALGSLLGVVLGFVLAQAPTAAKILNPHLMAINGIPRIALASRAPTACRFC
jgi:ABC-type nitrate/sulfonate/bicarbonate transport system permease component